MTSANAVNELVLEPVLLTEFHRKFPAFHLYPSPSL